MFPASASYVPEHALWRAVLFQAIADLRVSVQRRHRFLRRQALAWLLSKQREPGSFKWTCDLLDLNAAAVQSVALQLSGAQAQKRIRHLHRSLPQEMAALPRL